MRRTAAITLAIAGLLIAGCGSDTDGTEADRSETTEAPTETSAAPSGTEGAPGDADGRQGEAAQQAIDSAASGGLALDEECVNEVASRLSDEDAEIIATGAAAELSPEGAALSIELLDCADEDALTDLFIESIGQSGQNFDEDCVREKLTDFDVVEVMAQGQSGQPPADLVAALQECIATGG